MLQDVITTLLIIIVTITLKSCILHVGTCSRYVCLPLPASQDPPLQPIVIGADSDEMTDLRK